MLTVQEVDRLGRNLLEGLIVLTDLFERGIAVKVLEGIAAGVHTERSLILDLALAEDRRRDIVRKTQTGLGAARKRGKAGGWPRMSVRRRRGSEPCSRGTPRRVAPAPSAELTVSRSRSMPEKGKASESPSHARPPASTVLWTHFKGKR